MLPHLVRSRGQNAKCRLYQLSRRATFYEHEGPNLFKKGEADFTFLRSGNLWPQFLRIVAPIGVNNEFRNTALEPKMTQRWKADLFLMIGYTSITALLLLVAINA